MLVEKIIINSHISILTTKLILAKLIHKAVNTLNCNKEKQAFFFLGQFS